MSIRTTFSTTIHPLPNLGTKKSVLEINFHIFFLTEYVHGLSNALKLFLKKQTNEITEGMLDLKSLFLSYGNAFCS